MQVLRIRFVAISLLSLSLIAGACNGSSSETTVSTDVLAVTFARGTVPHAVPDSFPIPAEAVVGATLIDPNRELTEMILIFPANVGAIISYYEDNLPARGYVIASSGGSETEWQIEFDGEGVHGVITIRTGGSGVASATVAFTAT